MGERWRRVPGWPYQASSLGRIRTVARTLASGAELGPQILAPFEDRDGYQRVTLRAGSRRRTLGVHQLVLLAFEGPPEVRHRNGDPRDNSLANLLYGSRRDNERDKHQGRATAVRPWPVGPTGAEETEEEEETSVSPPLTAVSPVAGDMG